MAAVHSGRLGNAQAVPLTVIFDIIVTKTPSVGIIRYRIYVFINQKQFCELIGFTKLLPI